MTLAKASAPAGRADVDQTQTRMGGENLDFRKRFALSSYDATLKRSGLPPPVLSILVRYFQSRLGDICHGVQRLRAPLVS
jgi:hypothetical protein